MYLFPHLSGPLNTADFTDLMADFSWPVGPFTLAVAVSGGCDSLCLVWYAKDWIRARGGYLWTFTVDHQLRPGSTHEAQRVAQTMHTWGVCHTILTWAGPKPISRLQERARQARRLLLNEACKVRGIDYILTAHHQDDQLETVLMRQWKGSGPRGLAGISAHSIYDAIRWRRPFLSVEKERLRASLQSHNILWIEDPSNQRLCFERTHARRACEILSPTQRQQRLHQIHIYGLERQALERQANALLTQTFSFHAVYGYGIIHTLAPFQQAPWPVQELCWQHIFWLCRGQWKFIKRHNLQRFYRSLPLRDQTLSGCWIRNIKGQIFIYRESAAAAQRPLFPKTQTAIWDNRFRISFKALLPPYLHIESLGEHGVAFLKKNQLFFPALFPQVRQALHTLPALWQEDRIQEVPFFTSPYRWIKDCDNVHRTHKLISLFQLPSLRARGPQQDQGNPIGKPSILH